MNWGGLKRCCGGYLLFARPDLGFEMLEKVFRDFEKSDADAIVTACPHCHFNLDAFQFAIGRARKRALDVPVLHFTEVLALAMNLDLEREFERHVTSLLPLLERLITEEDKRKAADAKKRAKPAGFPPTSPDHPTNHTSR
jgi:heterodisulfide reductase subunit B